MKEVNALYSVIETSMNEGREVLFDHAVHPFNDDSVLRLEELVAWVSPFLGRLSDEPPRDNERIIVRKLPCLRPTLRLSHQVTRGGGEGGQFHSLKRRIHHLVHVDGTTVRTQFCLLRCKKGGWFVVEALPGFIWPEVGSGLLDSVLEFLV